MEGAPLFNYEDNSDSEDTEQADARNKKSKKRKKNTPDWLQRLLKPDEAKSSEEDSPETNRFLEAIKSPFGRLFGIEKEELAEEDEATTVDGEPDVAETRLPFMPAAFVDQEPTVVATPEEDSESEVELPQGLLINEDTAEEIASWDPEVDQSTELIPTEPISNEMDESATASQPEDAVGEVDRLRAEVESHAMAATEISPDRHVEQAGFTESRQETNSVKEREIIVEKRGGAGAAAVGFVAAELLSRSRDKKIRREAKRLKKKVERLENTNEADKLKAQKADAKNKQQLQELKERRRPQEHIKTPELPKLTPSPVIETRPAERIYSPRTEKAPEVVTKVPTATELRLQKAPTQEIPRYERIQEQKQEILTKIQEAAEQPYAGETYYERKHEVMDEPTVREKAAVASDGSTYGSGSWGVSDSGQTDAQQSPKTLPHQSKPVVSDEYRRAMVQGATTGIILLVGFVIVLILWSLL